MIDFEGNAKIADFNVMKNLESSLARTQKGTPLYMAPEVAYGEKYSEKVDIWSLCATFYYVFKSHGPYYNNKVKSSVELMIRKKDLNNYENLSEFYCPNETLRHIINFNLTNPDEQRMSAGDIIALMEGEVKLSHMSDLNSEVDKNTVFGKTGETNFMDETLVSQEINPSQLRRGQQEYISAQRTVYDTNAVSVIEVTKTRVVVDDKGQVEKKYQHFEQVQQKGAEDPYYNQVNFVKAKKIEDTVSQSEFNHIGIKPSILTNSSNVVSKSRYRQPVVVREDSPELAIVNISDEEKELNKSIESGYSYEEEFEDQGYNFSSDDEISVEVQYDDERQKEKDQYIFDSMMLERPDDLKEPLRKTKTEDHMLHVDNYIDPVQSKLMDTFLSRTGGEDLQYSVSVMPTPKAIKKSNKPVQIYGEKEPSVVFSKQNKQARNNLVRTGGNDSIEENKKQKRNDGKGKNDSFSDYGDFDEDLDYFENFEDIDNRLEADLNKTERTTFQGERQSESLYETQFGKDSTVKTQNFIQTNSNAHNKKKKSLLQNFEYFH